MQSSHVEPAPSAEAGIDSEPVMLIAVQPKEPEIFVMRLDSELEEPPTDLTVVREFDEGGNITSVTIHGESSTEDSRANPAPSMDRTHLLDVPPAAEVRAELPYVEGSAGNA